MTAVPTPSSTVTTSAPATALEQVRAYHQRTKHQPQRFAPGPDTLDWDSQPNPFRRYEGAPLTLLPLQADACSVPWSALFTPGAIAPQPLNVNSIALLLELSLALAAWKQYGPDRWAVRCNPSSGNLHPTEGWLISQGVGGLDDGLYHYAPREHGLEQRAQGGFLSTDSPTAPRAWLALSSILWREAWKYGERAFRYCQLDAGHATGALRYAAAVLGWSLRPVPSSSDQLAQLLGLDRDADFGAAEREEPELLLEIVTNASLPGARQPLARLPQPAPDWHWAGQANRLDRHPMYRWPVIAAVAHASRPTAEALAPATAAPHHAPSTSTADPAATNPTSATRATVASPPAAATLIRQRRSAQRFDARARAPLAQVLPLLAALQAPRLPLDAGPAEPRVHVLLFAHRIDGLAPGAYLLPRRAAALPLLQQTLGSAGEWSPCADVQRQAQDSGLGEVPLIRLAENPSLAGTLRTLNCHQALGSDAVMGFALLGEFDAMLEPAAGLTHPWAYRELFQEAGLLGQVLYMEAEAAGLAGTGIGCYFDDATHQLLGLADTRLQSLYHFTVGAPMFDARISHEPPYAHRQPSHPSAQESAP
jgi:SagB-type dehydrogenase family enzyme